MAYRETLPSRPTDSVSIGSRLETSNTSRRRMHDLVIHTCELVGAERSVCDFIQLLLMFSLFD